MCRSSVRSAGPAARRSVIVLTSIALAALDISGQSFWQGLAINLAIFMILTVSLNLTSGFTGVFSLGQIGFMALGAYISAILTLPLAEKAAYLSDLPSWLAGVHLDQVHRAVPGRVPRRDADRGGHRERRRLARRPGADAAVGPLRRGRDARLPRHRPGRALQRRRVHPRLADVLERHALHEPVVVVGVGPARRRTSCGGSSARRTAATCSSSATIGWPPRPSGSG